MRKRFVAEAGDVRLEIPESPLKRGDTSKILQKLNRAGFGLGSGHDEIKLESSGENWCMTLTTYVGGPVQHITFKKLGNERRENES